VRRHRVECTNEIKSICLHTNEINEDSFIQVCVFLQKSPASYIASQAFYYRNELKDLRDSLANFSPSLFHCGHTCMAK
jgi:hypothetical protein